MWGFISTVLLFGGVDLSMVVSMVDVRVEGGGAEEGGEGSMRPGTWSEVELELIPC